MSLHPNTICFPKCLQTCVHTFVRSVCMCPQSVKVSQPPPFLGVPPTMSLHPNTMFPKTPNRCIGIIRSVCTCQVSQTPPLLPSPQRGWDSHIKTNVYLPLCCAPCTVWCNSMPFLIWTSGWMSTSCLRGNSLSRAHRWVCHATPSALLCLAIMGLQL